jgi:hypothetical protein
LTGDPFLRDMLTPQGRAARAVYLLMTSGPIASEELTRALGYRGRFSVYDLLENLSLAVPLYYDEERGVWGILDPDKEQ